MHRQLRLPNHYKQSSVISTCANKIPKRWHTQELKVLALQRILEMHTKKEQVPHNVHANAEERDRLALIVVVLELF